MDIHRPKPIHGWRDFVKEVGTIVLGVCIALGAEQAVEWFHWRSQASQARAFIASEVVLNTRHAVVELRSEACVERRLDELSKILDAASRSGSLPPIGRIGVPPRMGWFSSTWDSVVASQTVTHFPPAQLAEISLQYNFVQGSAAMSSQELPYWGEISTMAGPGRRLDPASEAGLRTAISTARSLNRNLAYIAMFLVQRVAKTDLPFSPEDREWITGTRTMSLTSGKMNNPLNLSPMYDICHPLGAVPPQYGEGFLPGVPAVIPEVLKTLPKFEGH